MRLRHQLAVYSPIPAQALAAATTAAIGGHWDAPDELSELLCREYFADDALLCGSGTQALQIAIEAARREVGKDAIVAIPAFSCFDVATAAIGAGGSVALYDLDPLSLSPDLESLERTLVEGARVVVVAPLYGIPLDWDAVEQLASVHGALVIEDAAQGHGATYRSRPLGSFGKISTLSFGRGKGWTGGSGGAVMVRGLDRKSGWPVLAAAPTVDFGTTLRLYAQFALGRPALYGLPRAFPGLDLGETVYHPPQRPSRLSHSAASTVLATRSGSLEEAERRRAAAADLAALVSGNPSFQGISSAAGDEGSAGFLRFPVLAKTGLRGFADPSAAISLGIAPSYPRRLSELAQLAPSIVSARMGFPGASRLAPELITLPTHSLITSADRQDLARLIQSYDGG